jgi:hypothetical protein
LFHIQLLLTLCKQPLPLFPVYNMQGLESLNHLCPILNPHKEPESNVLLSSGNLTLGSQGVTQPEDGGITLEALL